MCNMYSDFEILPTKIGKRNIKKKLEKIIFLVYTLKSCSVKMCSFMLKVIYFGKEKTKIFFRLRLYKARREKKNDYDNSNGERKFG